MIRKYDEQLCVKCEAPFIPTGPKTKRCPACAIIFERNRRKMLARYRRANRYEEVLAKEQKWIRENHEKILCQAKIWRAENPDKTKSSVQRYQFNNRERIRTRRAERLKNDIGFKLRKAVRNRLWYAMDGYKTGSAVESLGCTIDELKRWLENLFQPGMAWDNYGQHGWHIDHIKPLILFDLTNLEQFKQACHYTNLQPLWAKDNLEKGSKYE